MSTGFGFPAFGLVQDFAVVVGANGQADVSPASLGSRAPSLTEQATQFLRRPAPRATRPNLQSASAVDLGIVVAPGVVVEPGDFVARFAGLDLARYQQRMSPGVFATYARFFGQVPGSPASDPVRSARLDSER